MSASSFSTPAVRAWRIRFVTEVTASDSVFCEVEGPDRHFAALEPEPPEKLLQPSAPIDATRELRFLFIESGTSAATDWRVRAEAWMVDEQREGHAIDLVHRSDRILWRPGQAVMVGSSERLDETLGALVGFALQEGALRALEDELETAWPDADRDVALVRQVDATHLERRSHVNAATEQMVRARMQFARLERKLEKPSVSLPPGTRRLVAELVVLADVPDRLRAVDDGLEVLEDLYELANDRLSELSYFLGEVRLELWIIALLTVEVALLVLDLARHWS